jgi:hypothetical protein
VKISQLKVEQIWKAMEIPGRSLLLGGKWVPQAKPFDECRWFYPLRELIMDHGSEFGACGIHEEWHLEQLIQGLPGRICIKPVSHIFVSTHSLITTGIHIMLDSEIVI